MEQGTPVEKSKPVLSSVQKSFAVTICLFILSIVKKFYLS